MRKALKRAAACVLALTLVLSLLGESGRFLAYAEDASAGAWDGSLDFTWYNENARQSEYHIKTPSQWAALAWICSEDLAYLDDNVALTTNGNVPYIEGAIPREQYTFPGVKIYLDADLDMGGIYDSSGEWSGPNYYPIGGQYRNDGYVHAQNQDIFYGIFSGQFDGQGHTVYNIYCSRGWGTSQNDSAGWYQGAGLFGRVGVLDGSDYSDADVIIENVAVNGYIESSRSVGGVVGKTMPASPGQSVIIRGCMNFATVTNSDKKGVGGIVGSAWNGCYIINCANFGKVVCGMQNGGGITGTSEATCISCYNVGDISESVVNHGQAYGTDNFGTELINFYYAVDSVFDVGYPAIYSAYRDQDEFEFYGLASDDMRSPAFLERLNKYAGEYGSWVIIPNDERFDGFPVPEAFGDGSYVEPEPIEGSYAVTFTGEDRYSVTLERENGSSVSYRTGGVFFIGADETVTLTFTADEDQSIKSVSRKGGGVGEAVLTPTGTPGEYRLYAVKANWDIIVETQYSCTHSFTVLDSLDPTCTEDGYELLECTKCGYMYTQILPAAGHDYRAEVVAPTLTEQGYTRYVCANCGDEYVSDYTWLVHFELNGGEGEAPDQVIPVSGTAVCPADPTHPEEWKFAGWYADEDRTRLYDFSTPVESSLTLYADWSATAWRVRFSGTNVSALIGGTAMPETVVREESGSVTFRAEPDFGYEMADVIVAEIPPEGIWDGSAADGFAEGLGTKASPYLVSSAAELAYLAELVNGGKADGEPYGPSFGTYYRLTCNIDLNGLDWTPIGVKSACPFEGIFDGGGHTVTNLKVTGDNTDDYWGLFGFVSYGSYGRTYGIIENLTVKGEVNWPVIAFSYQGAAGGIAGWLKGGQISNCVSYVTVKTGATAGYITGGIVGGMEKSTSSVPMPSVENCVNYGDVTGYSHAGGIVGKVAGGVISDCFNFGNISAKGAAVGGIVGYLAVGPQGGGTQVLRCGNHAAVTGAGTGPLAAGGVAGYISTSTFIPYGSTANIEDCYNVGDVTNGGTYTGGVAGELPHGNTVLLNCYNRGGVSGTYSNTGYAGGIIGRSVKTGVTVQNCYSTGAVKVTKGYRGYIAGWLAAVSEAVSNNYYVKSSPTLSKAWGNLTANTGAALIPADAPLAAEQPGGAYKEDTQGLNGGWPVLAWQTGLPRPVQAAELTDHGDGTYTLSNISADATVYLYVRKQTYQVAFRTEQGTAPETQNVLYGGKAADPELTVSNYRLEGWYTDPEFTALYDFNSPVSENLTLYAKWSFQYYLVHFSFTYESEIPEQRVEGEPWLAAAPETDPVRTGYRFTGWYTDMQCTIPYDFTAQVTEDLKLYAGWTPAAFTLTVDPDNGDAAAEQTVIYGNYAVKPGADPVKEGFIFAGWYLADGEELTEPFSFSTTTLTQDTLVRAKWARAVPVRFDVTPAETQVRISLNGKIIPARDDGSYLLGEGLRYYYTAGAQGYRTANGLVWELQEPEQPAQQPEEPAQQPEEPAQQPEDETLVLLLELEPSGSAVVNFDSMIPVTVDGETVTSVETETGGGLSFNLKTPAGQEVTKILLNAADGEAAAAYADVWDGVTADADWPGSGTQDDPYLILSAAQLAGVAWTVNQGDTLAGKYFLLAADLDLDGKAWTPIGGNDRLTAGSRPLLNRFEGSFDGGGHTISNLYIDSDQYYVGLFGYLVAAEVKNLTLENAGVTGQRYVGALAGAALENSVISNCAVSGAVRGTYRYTGTLNEYTWVGGLTGCLSGVMKDCANSAQVSGDYCVGGLAGSAEEGGASSLLRCRNTGAVSGSGLVGGVIGLAVGTTVNCAENTGTVDGGIETGGIAGRADGAGLIFCANRGALTGTQYLGGLAGMMRNAAALSYSYNTGDVTLLDYAALKSVRTAGGLAGAVTVESALESCYSTGSVSGASNTLTGALTGIQMLGTALENCFWLETAAENAVGELNENVEPGVQKLRADQMKYGNLLASLNGETDVFVRDYSDENGGYPVNAWQSPLEVTVESDGSWTVALKDIQGDMTVTVEADQVKYNVSWTVCEAYTVTPARDTPLPLTYGQDFRFTVTLSPGYEESGLNSLFVTADGQQLLLTRTGAKSWSGEIKGVTDNRQMTVGGYEKGTYTVTFDANRGDGGGQVRVTYPNPVSRPEDPTRVNEKYDWVYTFLGWYYDQDAAAEYDFDTPVSQDLTLYAGWYFDQGMYMVYDLNLPAGGSAAGVYAGVTKLRVEEEQGAKLTEPPAAPTCTFANGQISAEFLYWADSTDAAVDLAEYTVPALSETEMAYYKEQLTLPETTLHAVWKVTTQPGDGAGRYLIGDAYTLETLAASVNSGEISSEGMVWVLSNDIVLDSALTIGSKDVPFQGILTSFGGTAEELAELTARGEEVPRYSITLAAGQNSGLFGYLGQNAVVAYVNVSGHVLSEGYTPAGILANVSLGAVSHCTVSGSVSGDGALGGMVGQSGINDVGGRIETVISHCVNNAAVISRGQTGQQGAAGGGTSGSTASVRGVGGIAGVCVGVMENCENHGEITYLPQANVVAPYYAGGICGMYYGASLTNCVNTGDLISMAEGGGLIGTLYPLNTCVIENCANSGDITVNGRDGGGLVGISRDGKVEFRYCANQGDVHHAFPQAGITPPYWTTSTGAEMAWIGGLIGDAEGGASFYMSSNTGNVDAAGNCVGGLAGLIRGEGTVNYCYSSGNLNAAGSVMVGGLVGYLEFGSIRNAYWYGQLLYGGADRVGYAVGDGSVSVRNFYFADDVQLATGVAAIGEPAGETVVSKPRSAFRSGEVSYLIDFGDPAGGVSARDKLWSLRSEAEYPLSERYPTLGEPEYYMVKLSCGEGGSALLVKPGGDTYESVAYVGRGHTVTLDVVPSGEMRVEETENGKITYHWEVDQVTVSYVRNADGGQGDETLTQSGEGKYTFTLSQEGNYAVSVTFKEVSEEETAREEPRGEEPPQDEPAGEYPPEAETPNEGSGSGEGAGNGAGNGDGRGQGGGSGDGAGGGADGSGTQAGGGAGGTGDETVVTAPSAPGGSDRSDSAPTTGLAPAADTAKNERGDKSDVDSETAGEQGGSQEGGSGNNPGADADVSPNVFEVIKELKPGQVGGLAVILLLLLAVAAAAIVRHYRKYRREEAESQSGKKDR